MPEHQSESRFEARSRRAGSALLSQLAAVLPMADISMPATDDAQRAQLGITPAGECGVPTALASLARVLHRQSSGHAVLTGRKGVGKTTLVRQMAALSASGEIPFLKGSRFLWIDCQNVGPEDSRACLESIFAAVIAETADRNGIASQDARAAGPAATCMAAGFCGSTARTSDQRTAGPAWSRSLRPSWRRRRSGTGAQRRTRGPLARRLAGIAAGCDGHIPDQVTNVPDRVPVNGHRVPDGDPDVPDDVPDLNARQRWVLSQIRKGTEVRVNMVVTQFGCSQKTAKRDLSDLRDQRLVRFVGSPRTGHYRLV